MEPAAINLDFKGSISGSQCLIAEIFLENIAELHAYFTSKCGRNISEGTHATSPTWSYMLHTHLFLWWRPSPRLLWDLSFSSAWGRPRLLRLWRASRPAGRSLKGGKGNNIQKKNPLSCCCCTVYICDFVDVIETYFLRCPLGRSTGITTAGSTFSTPGRGVPVCHCASHMRTQDTLSCPE